LLRGAGDIFNEEALSFNSQSGILTAYEAMNLNFDHTRLVVLSACETGLGEVQVGEGVFGLQRAFQVAGAKQIIMSLFKVDDAVTQKLMSEFYKNLLNNTDTRAAFRQAQKTIKQQYKNPIFWGAFVVVGVE
ncbi:MAG: CHAT domain-containing protein, partial [Bacteroidota bacterium]